MELVFTAAELPLMARVDNPGSDIGGNLENLLEKYLPSDTSRTIHSLKAIKNVEGRYNTKEKALEYLKKQGIDTSKMKGMRLRGLAVIISIIEYALKGAAKKKVSAKKLAMQVNSFLKTFKEGSYDVPASKTKEKTAPKAVKKPAADFEAHLTAFVKTMKKSSIPSKKAYNDYIKDYAGYTSADTEEEVSKEWGLKGTNLRKFKALPLKNKIQLLSYAWAVYDKTEEDILPEFLSSLK